MVLTAEERLLQQKPRATFDLDTTSGGIQTAMQSMAQRQAQLDSFQQQRAMQQEQAQSADFEGFELPQIQQEQVGGVPQAEFQGQQLQPREGLPPITQVFGQKSKFDVFSGGVNYGVDFGIKEGTPVGLPAGQWEVVEAFGGAGNRGFIGDNTNRGYGNSVLVKNAKTGETLRLSHLQRVNVRPGQVIPGGTIIGASGATGNVTGAHLDVEYKDQSGRLRDVLKTPYANQLVGR